MLTILEPLQLSRKDLEVLNILQAMKYSVQLLLGGQVLTDQLFLYAASNGASRVSGSPLAGKLFVVMGAGGAGKALAFGGKEKGARVVVANRSYGENL
jgi:glutamate dehydrogenase/leucine dehydrogenase